MPRHARPHQACSTVRQAASDGPGPCHVAFASGALAQHIQAAARLPPPSPSSWRNSQPAKPNPTPTNPLHLLPSATGSRPGTCLSAVSSACSVPVPDEPFARLADSISADAASSSALRRAPLSCKVRTSRQKGGEERGERGSARHAGRQAERPAGDVQLVLSAPRRQACLWAEHPPFVGPQASPTSSARATPGEPAAHAAPPQPRATHATQATHACSSPSPPPPRTYRRT